MVLPLRDEGAISLGLSNLPGLFVGSLVLTLIAAPLSTLLFSLPNLPKARALVLMHRFFSFSLVIFFILWHSSTRESTTTNLKASVTASSMSEHDQNSDDSQAGYMHSGGWEGHSWLLC